MGIASNIPNFEDPLCFVSEGNETGLVHKMVDYMVKILDAANATLQEKYNYVFNALAISPSCRSENLLKEFDAFIRELPILDYNSSKIRPSFILNHIDSRVGGKNRFCD